MEIVLKWNFKNLFADIPRLVLTLVNNVGTVAVLIGTCLSLEAFTEGLGSLNEGIPHYITEVLPPIIQIPFAVTTYVIFSAQLAERKSQYLLLRSSGCTTRQLLQGLIIEAFWLDAVGLPLGLGAGLTLAWLLGIRYEYALTAAAFFSDAVFLRSLLPSVFIVPTAMLCA